MTSMPWDAQGEAQAALRAIVTDPQHGPAALSDAQMMTHLLKDMLPDSPKELRVLIAASDVDVPGMLQSNVSQGLAWDTASRQAAGSFQDRTALTPEACRWAVSVLGSALRLDAAGARPEPVTAQEAARSGNGQRTTTAPAPRAVPAVASEPRGPQAPTADESTFAPGPTTPTAPPAAQPPIRKGVAFAGTVLALLAGVGGFINQRLLWNQFLLGYDFSRTLEFFSLAIYVVVTVAALIALMQINRLVISGYLQGILWLGAASLVAFIWTGESDFSGGPQGLHKQIVTFAPEVIAAILLMVSWSPAVDRRQARQIRGLPLMILGVAGLSQISALIFYVTIRQDGSFYYVLGSAQALVVVAVTWYAMSLRRRALGGALVLGWVTGATMLLISYMYEWWSYYTITGLDRFCVILGYVLLAAVVVLTIIYVRGSSDLEGSDPDPGRAQRQHHGQRLGRHR